MHRCEYEGCGKSFKKLSALKLHINTHTGKRPFECPWCDKAYFKSTHLAVHMEGHEEALEEEEEEEKKRHACEACGKVLATKFSLERHRRVCGVRYKCDLCQKEYERLAWFDDHMERHGKQRGRSSKIQHCPHCEKGFSLLRYLRQHVKNVHGKGREYSCGVCGEKSFYKHVLERHKKKEKH